MRTPWIAREDHMAVVQFMLKYDLLKYGKDLPLKSGGTTDIYINLRNARSDPYAMTGITKLFEAPLRKISPNKFIEVPDSLSGVAAGLSILTEIPYITVRSAPRETIGAWRRGDSVCIIDDVIADGTSKIDAMTFCSNEGLFLNELIVLVDRQQRHNFDVWPGMTLHDVRRCLFELGIIHRTENSNPIILALDGLTWSSVLPVIDKLRLSSCILKVNDLIFSEGFELLTELSVYGRVMVDLKCHDILNTVTNTCRKLKKYNPWAVTVHGSGGLEMIKAAQDALGPETEVLVITVLTSLDDEDCKKIYGCNTKTEVKRLAAIADEAHAGVVCSAQDVEMLRKLYPNMLLITPGIRSKGVGANDQKRVATPVQAMKNGADYIVMGRQIMRQDPVEEVRKVLEEINASRT